MASAEPNLVSFYHPWHELAWLGFFFLSYLMGPVSRHTIGTSVDKMMLSMYE